MQTTFLLANKRLFNIGDEQMNKVLLAIAAILLIWTSQCLHTMQMKNANSIDTDRMQRYVEHINATNQLNSYDRR